MAPAICGAGKLGVLARGVQRREAIVRELVQAALGPGADPGTVTAVRAVAGSGVRRSLPDAGRSTTQAATIARLLLSGI